MISIGWFVAALVTAASFAFFSGAYLSGIRCDDARQRCNEMADAVSRLMRACNALDAAHVRGGATIFARNILAEELAMTSLLIAEVRHSAK